MSINDGYFTLTQGDRCICSAYCCAIDMPLIIQTVVLYCNYSSCTVSLVLAMHYAYYKIQNNPSLVEPEKKSDLFYVRWLKEKFPALRPYGINTEKPEPPASSMMTTIRPFDVMDMLKFNNVNLDSMTETYGFNFYLYYLVNWPEYYQVAEHPNGQIMGYIMGKAEGRDENWHGHVTALSVAPDYRRLGLGARMMYTLEHISDMKKAYFVDLFVRVSNHVAITMYKALGYVVYREIIDYYSGPRDENAYDMRKALSMDKEKKSMIPLPHPMSSESQPILLKKDCYECRITGTLSCAAIGAFVLYQSTSSYYLKRPRIQLAIRAVGAVNTRMHKSIELKQMRGFLVTSQYTSMDCDVLFVMGVSGCGKSTVGRELAVNIGFTFKDGDDFHSKSNVAKMKAGQCYVEYLKLFQLSNNFCFFFTLTSYFRELLEIRLKNRKNHYMPITLLDSQLATLEKPSKENDVISISIAEETPNLIEIIVKQLKHN
ncbi:carbohydrate kinase, thermoresistant glucokinase family [Dictyocaulus viviparus]|uniref:N-alpha-acetyltransferase 20 n=1 Tax=Dictyocaulus viviparus TaxID=29172 RepID=A0A0D8Y8M6_DICVI|nr:carbohydrate kinase, thermoresistant glucokinase family [Dictyocaulus viviparus]